MRGRIPSFRKKSIAAALATFVGIVSFGIFLFASRSATAAPVEVTNVSPGEAVLIADEKQQTAQGIKAGLHDSAQAGRETRKEAEAKWTVSLTNTAAVAVLNGLNYFAQKIAYDAAVYVSSGGKGQVPLIFDRPGAYFKSVTGDAAGEILGTLTTDPATFGKYGVNLCVPKDPKLALNLKLGFLKSLPSFGVGSAPVSKCSWDSISTNWETFTGQSSADVLDNVGVMFSPGESSLAAAIEVNSVALKEINLRTYTAGIEQAVGDGFKPVVDKISGTLKTPASTVKKTFEYSVDEGYKVKDNTTLIAGSAFGAGALGVLSPALKTFAGVLTDKLTKKIFEQGLISISDLLGGDDGDKNLEFDAAPSMGGRATAELANASLLTPKILTVSNYNELLDFASCPEENRTPSNCVIDQQFYGALSRVEQGVTVTLRQAIQQGYLNRNWQLLPLAHRKNLQGNCFNEAFCYSNLVKLRKARIIPAGWEIAANSPFNESSRPVTLGEAMDRFNDCPMTTDADGEQVVDTTRLPDPAHPWCHLVDPEWVLKYPASLCRQRGPGPTPVSSQSANRAQVCVDVATCVSEDASGNCIGGYGYCVREKSAWKLDADACPAHYASCSTYQRAGGGTVSYLSNTLDGAACNSQNAGCRQYSLSPNAVPNPGFEDALGDEPRDWTLSAQARYHRGGRLSSRGSGAVGVSGGARGGVRVGGLLPGTAYRLSGSVMQEDENTTALGTIRVALLDDAGAAIDAGTLTTTCESDGTGTAVDLDIVSTSLGYLSGACEITLPEDAVAAEITIFSDAAGDNRTWFDEIGLFGGSFSASPYDAVFMNAKAEKCADDQAGCSRFARLATGTLNVLRNPSFEDAEGDLPAFWKGASASRYENSTLLGQNGISAYALSTVPITQTIDGITADASYAFSVFSRREASGATSGTARIQIYDSSRPPAPVAPVAVDGCDLVGDAIVVDLADGADFALSECRFTTPQEAGSAVISLSANALAPRILADAAQLELSVRATSFHAGYSAATERVFLKKAPGGLNCVGSNPSPECAKYAPSCRRDEVGCNSYQPLDGGIAVPAVTTDADACPSECSGYDTFRQEPSDFNDAEFPVFLIPPTAQSCTASEAGCSEFTNIERLAAGGESREYYSYLRLCAEPGPRSATYYTWEGSGESGDGIRLRSWALLRSDIAAAAIGESDPTGGNAPCTKLAYDVSGRPVCADDAVSVAAASCSKGLVGSYPDCREFYDDAGNIHYRLYSKTVVSTEECKEYRITKTTETECGSHGGFWKNGECRYRSYAAESVSCRAEAAGCRAYSGNASRNLRVVFTDTLENGTTDGWVSAPGAGSPLAVVNSNESVAAAGHSLKVARAEVFKDVALSLRRGRQYVLTFWAKGTGDLTARLNRMQGASFTLDRVSGTEKPISLTTEWKPYQVGPIELASAPASDEHVVIERLGGGSPLMYLDNIELRELTENIFLIDGSWETPASCDETPAGDAAPQYMLGCRAYSDKDRIRAHFKSFEKLCRPEAVGCEALYDTRNSESPYAQAFNAVCSLPDGPDAGAAPDVCTELSCPCAFSGKQVCEVVLGSSSCRFDADEEVPPENVSPTGDTARVAADGIVYLVNDKRFRCESSNMGCSELGDRTMNPDRLAVRSWSKKTLKNLPSSYATTLCKSSEEFCQAYTSRADGAQVYFKDPDTRVCEFREATTLSSNGVNGNGWFRKGSNEPCDDEFLEAGTRFGIWKNSDARYEGWAGTCEARYDMCKEFIDPEDRSAGYEGGKAYFAIMNDRLDVKTCQGRASLRQSPLGANDASACVLFWQTDDLKKRYDAKLTYEASEAANGALVTPLSGADDTANVIIKVKRDRQCGEWLDCRSSENVFNATTGQYQSVCTAFSLCAEFERAGDTTRCVRYVESSYSGRTLTPGIYAGRDVSWEGMEYSGYGIPNRYPVEELVTFNVGPSSTSPELRLVRSIGTCSEAYGAACGPAGDKGTCMGPGPRRCVYPIDGGRRVSSTAELRQPQNASGYPGTACRVYPQEAAPFPSSVADPGGWDNSASEINNGNPVLIGPSPAFASANVCERRLVKGVEVSSCECSYIIAKYGGQSRYFPVKGGDVPQGFCVGGQFDGHECDPLSTGARSPKSLSCCTKTADQGLVSFDNSCDDGAQCVRLSKVDRVVGYEGQCLERDFTTPINGRSDEFACVTWRPVNLIGGSRDIYNQNQSAGYFAAADRRFYCVGHQPGWTLQFDIPALNKDDDDHDNNLAGDLAFDADGDGELTPLDLDIMKFFGPGTISGATGQSGWRMDCEVNGDESSTGGWCVWPGLSTPSNKPKIEDGKSVSCSSPTSDCGSGYHCAITPDDVEGACVSDQTDYTLQSQALGILGCYELADGGSTDQQYIEWPYIGPPVYRQQLASIYFQITDDIYDYEAPLQPGEVNVRATESVTCPGDPRCVCPPSGCSVSHQTHPSFADVITNPHQNVIADCNDDGGDNIDNEDNESIDSSPVSESDVVTLPDHGRVRSVFHLEEKNGWRVDPSDGEGVIILSASFNGNGQLIGLKLAASDSDEEGAFGINRVGFQYKPGCEQIAQVDQPDEFGATVAFTDSVNSYRDFQASNMRDTFNDSRNFGDACRPYGAIGAVTSAPTAAGSVGATRSPWTYVAGRRVDDVAQCTDLDFMKGVVYWKERPEDQRSAVSPAPTPLELWGQSVRRLFRSVFAVWDYRRLLPDATQGDYTRATGANQTFDETSLVDSTSLLIRGRNSVGWYPPRIASVDLDTCRSDGSCAPMRLRALTVNGRDDGLVPGADGAMNVTAKFFAWAGHDAMPIVSRSIMWGDFSPSEPQAKGWYKNQKPFCSPDTTDENAVGECDNGLGLTCNASADCPDDGACTTVGNHFGNTPGACAAAPYQFDHTYTCSLRDLQAMPACSPTNPADNAPCHRMIAGSPVCVYRPKVQIVDNWGWCNCTGSGCDENFGAYSSIDGAADGCDISNAPANAKPWTEFGGEVRLAPNFRDGQAFTSITAP
mgnify:FL=1